MLVLRRELLPTSDSESASVVRASMDAATTSEPARSADPAAVARRVLVVGSSPISLLIALTASRLGHHVTLAERSERLGGAWACDEVEGHLIDRACHLLEPRAPARRWVFEQLGEEPRNYPHPPAAVTPWNTVWSIQSRRYRALELALAWPAAARHLASALGGDRAELRRVATECSHDIGRLTRRAVQELWRGPAAMVTFSPQPFARLCLLVSETVDEIRLSQNVSRVSYAPQAPEFSVLLGQTEQHFDHVVVPSGADIEIEVAGRQVDRKQFHFENHHLLIEAATGDRNLSYVAFMADTRVRRVVDAGPVETAGPGRHRYLAHVRSADVTVEDVVGVLADHGYVDSSQPARLMRHYRFTSTRTMFSGSLPTGLWAPDTYGDLSDNLARLLVRSGDHEVHLRLPFAGVGR